jgi:hypothetical protein
VILTTSRGVNKVAFDVSHVAFDVSHVAFDVSSLCWEYRGSTCLICEVLFGHLVDLPLHSSLMYLLCLLLLNFVLGGLNFVEHGVDHVLWSFGSRFLASIGSFCLQVSFWYYF